MLMLFFYHQTAKCTLKNKPDNFKYKNSLFKKLEGKSRPHFFYGVTKVVSKLLTLLIQLMLFLVKKMLNNQES